MTVVMKMHWHGLTPDQYDAVRERVDWERNPADGGKLHVAWFGDGLNVFDVWDSPEHFEAFGRDRLMPAVAAEGITSQPDVAIVPCHAYQREIIPGGHLLVERSTIPAVAYDVLAVKVDFASNPPVGGVCHIAAGAEGEMLDVLSVWRSTQACVRFALDRVAPVATELALPLKIDGNPPPLAVAHAVWAP